MSAITLSPELEQAVTAIAVARGMSLQQFTEDALRQVVGKPGTTSTEFSREALEALALSGYKAGELTEHQVQEMLGFETRFDVHRFLKANNVYQEMTLEEFDANRQALDKLLDTHS